LAEKRADGEEQHHHTLNDPVNFSNKYSPKLWLVDNHQEAFRLQFSIRGKLMLLAEENSKKLGASGHIAFNCCPYIRHLCSPVIQEIFPVYCYPSYYPAISLLCRMISNTQE